MSPPEDKNLARWLLLIHQIPRDPAYFRAKVARRLSRVGAVPIKNSVYILPLNEQTQEDLEWLAREITEEGGDATLCRASFVEGLRDKQIETLFHTARDAEYGLIAEEARDALAELPTKVARDDERRPAWETTLTRLMKRIEETIAIDFFAAPGRETASSAIAAFESRLHRGAQKPPDPKAKPAREDYQGRVWVTRTNVHVDRIACAWLVTKFIDAKAKFKFVPAQGYKPKSGEVTFDMFEADFTHEGDRCSFEVLIERFGLREVGLKALAEIIHDIDVKDGKFGRAEAAGIASLVAAIALAHREDEARITFSTPILDALVDLYRRKRA